MKFVKALSGVALSCAAVSGAVQGSHIKLDELYAIRYGKVIACHSLSADHDGSYIFHRYLLAPPELSGLQGAFQELAGDSALVSLEKVAFKGEGKANSLPFYHERYRLDGQFHICTGTVTKGEVSLSGGLFSERENPAEYCRFADEKLESCAEVQGSNLQGSGVTFENTLGINLSERGSPGAINVDVSSGTSPLVLVAHGWTKHFRQVYDPLHRLYDATSLSSVELNNYTHGNRAYSAGLSLASGVAASLVIPARLTVGPILAVPIAWFALAGAATSLGIFIRDASQTPQKKIISRKQELNKERVGVNSDLAKARMKREATGKLLLERYGLSGDKEDLKVHLQDYGNRTSVHYINTLTERNDMEKLKGQLRDAELVLRDINEKGKRIHVLNTRLQALDKQIADVGRSSTYSRNMPDSEQSFFPLTGSEGLPSPPGMVFHQEDNSLPSPEFDVMPRTESVMTYEPVHNTRLPAHFAAGAPLQLHQLESLEYERRNLALERDYLVLESQSSVWGREAIQGTISSMRQRIYILQGSLNRKEAVYEREIGEPKRLLEGHLVAIEDIESLVARRGVLDKKVDEVDLHRELLTLIKRYQEYQRQPR